LVAKVKEKIMASKKFRFGILTIVLVFTVFFTGCVTRIGDFTVMSSKNVDLSRLGEFSRSSKTIKGTDSLITVLGFITVKSQVDLKKALDNALSKIPGAQALVDVRIDVRRLNFLLFEIDSYIVSGTVLIDPRVVGASETTADKPYLVMETDDGEDFIMRYVSKEEYFYLLAKN
jgi:hypothetical protein